MTFPIQYSNRYAYHFSHIDNLQNLITTGFLATNHPTFPNKYRSIASTRIQERRSQMAVPCGPRGCVHDYVPLYFGSCSPMLLSVLYTKNVDQSDILYFEFPITILERAETVFTDASANTNPPPNFYSNPTDLDKLDWKAIDSLKWGNIDDEFRHRRMAELLVFQTLPLTEATRCVVWNEEIKDRVVQLVGGRPFPKIEFEDRNRRHYYTNIELKDESTLVIGPREIDARYRAACSEVAVAIANKKVGLFPSFDNLASLLHALQLDFGCLPQTSELVGLKSANGVHKKTVDLHTQDVVARLKALPEYSSLDHESKVIVQVATYLHDIGKGPRARWNNNGGLQRVDPNHPVGAMPMMVNILTTQVKSVKPESAFTLMKLVCYHDLVGDVLGKGRDERQISAVIDNKKELDMLFAIGKADATSLVEHWWDQHSADLLYNRCLATLN